MRSLLASLVLVAALAGCSEEVNVHVDCKTTASTVECSLHQNKGKSEVEACFDFIAVCDNGVEVKATKNCAKVKDGGTVGLTIPTEKLVNIEKCGGSKPPVAKADNLTLNGKASK
ncbi:MAG: hypothetical protein JNL83_36015 [Myxococcales bacterium]|nr:hypothetical protein [Myxococcales bacterium]